MKVRHIKTGQTYDYYAMYRHDKFLYCLVVDEFGKGHSFKKELLEQIKTQDEKENSMSEQPMCQTCRRVVVQGGRGTKCVNCWEVEHRICHYISSSRGLRKVLAAIHNEMSNEKHFEGL